MSADQIADLEQEWKHASQIAFVSIGQTNYAANAAYRDELAAKLHAARAEDA